MVYPNIRKAPGPFPRGKGHSAPDEAWGGVGSSPALPHAHCTTPVVLLCPHSPPLCFLDRGVPGGTEAAASVLAPHSLPSPLLWAPPLLSSTPYIIDLSSSWALSSHRTRMDSKLLRFKKNKQLLLSPLSNPFKPGFLKQLPLFTASSFR